MQLSASDLLDSLHLAATARASHAGTVPLVVVAIVLFVAAVIVRKIIKLALVVVIAAIIALVIAGWRAGLFG